MCYQQILLIILLIRRSINAFLVLIIQKRPIADETKPFTDPKYPCWPSRDAP